jgi:hypothetical protein
MLHHIVMIKYKPETPAEIAQQFCDAVMALQGVIPEIVSVTIGCDALKSTRSWDLALHVTLGSMEDLSGYQTHPAHVAVLEKNNPWVAEVGAVDFSGA